MLIKKIKEQIKDAMKNKDNANGQCGMNDKFEFTDEEIE